MKRTLAITATTALLALLLTGCGDTADRTNGNAADNVGGTTATDTMRNDNGMTGTGTTSGATANENTAGAGTTGGNTTGTGTAGTGMTGTDGANTGLGGVTGAVNRGYAANGNYALSGNYTGTEGHRSASTYTAMNNGGYTGASVDYSDDAAVRRAAKAGDNYARMLENGRVHDSDGFLLDGENASWRTF